MKRLLIVGAALLALGLFAGTASAQIRPQPVVGYFCATAQYDIDGDGLLTKTDIRLWAEKIIADNCLDQEATGICAQYDQNRDGRVDESDLRVRVDYFLDCVRISSVIPRGVEP